MAAAITGESEQGRQRSVSPSVQHQKDLDKLPPGLRGIWQRRRQRRTAQLKNERNGRVNAAGHRGGEKGRRTK